MTQIQSESRNLLSPHFAISRERYWKMVSKECCWISNNREVNVQFIGRFNASNLLAVYGADVCWANSRKMFC